MKKAKAQETVYVLRTCDKDMKAYGGFVWPRSGPVCAPDWEKTTRCGNGLHGLMWGSGDVSRLSFAQDAVWMVVAVDKATIVDLGDKVKFPSGEVVFCGDRPSAVAEIVARGADSSRVVYYTATAGYGGTATAGYGGTATAGECGTATAGDGGTATAGDRGTATAGDGGTATAGYRGTATAGDGGTATAGDGGTIAILWWDNKREKYRRAVAEVGENGIEKNKPYFVKNGVLTVKQ